MSVLEQLELAKAAKARRIADENRLRCEQSLCHFLREGWHVLKPHEPYRHNWHHDAICEHLQAVSDGEILRLQIWVPPGTSKTMYVSIFWPAWEWTTNPWLRYWSASYEVRFAGRIAALSRDLMTSEWYQGMWGEKFEIDRDAEAYFTNDQGGTRLATAPQSTGSGEHGHRILIDDPINAKDADATSRVTLDACNAWWDGTASTRGVSTGRTKDANGEDVNDHARVIIMQRLHENDLAAHAMESEPWEVLCLPERYERKHPFVWPGDPRTEDGQLLWPSHRNEQQSDTLAKQLTTHRAAGQLQQRPSAREGEILKLGWWRFYDPRIRAQDRWSELGRFSMVVQSVDTPLKDKDSSDNVAIQLWGVRGADRYLLDLRCEKLGYAPAKRAIKDMGLWARRMWPGAMHFLLIENAGYGPELIVDLKRELTGVTKIPAGLDGDKEIRATSASDALESGNCFVPGYGPPWQPAYDEVRCPADVVGFLSSCARFPNATHDDDVDAWSQAMNWLRSRQTTPLRTASAHRR